jgi:hypothetical protein
VNRQVNNSLYGGSNMSMGSVKYGGSGTTSRPMPSEVRNAYYKSGATPSEVRMNAAAMGPLTPNGPIDYIPKRGSNDGGRGGYAPQPAMMPSYNTGSVRRPVMPPSPNQTLIAPKQFNSAIPPTQFR